MKVTIDKQMDVWTLKLVYDTAKKPIEATLTAARLRIVLALIESARRMERLAVSAEL